MTDSAAFERTYAKPLWIRLWHWGNAFLIIGLALSGASLHFSDPKLTLLEFSLAASIHSFTGVALVFLYVSFVAGNVASGNWRRFVPASSALLGRCLAQARYYAWGTFKGEPSPSSTASGTSSFNALQAVVYCVILFLVMPAVVGSGLVFLYPEVAPDQAFGMSGLMPVAIIHYVTAALVIAFMIGHIYLGTMGRSPTSAFRTMVTGWEDKESPHVDDVLRKEKP
jgi:thiosulfate reductase cytochrome b subunit